MSQNEHNASRAKAPAPGGYPATLIRESGTWTSAQASEAHCVLRHGARLGTFPAAWRSILGVGLIAVCFAIGVASTAWSLGYKSGRQTTADEAYELGVEEGYRGASEHHFEAGRTEGYHTGYWDCAVQSGQVL